MAGQGRTISGPFLAFPRKMTATVTSIHPLLTSARIGTEAATEAFCGIGELGWRESEILAGTLL